MAQQGGSSEGPARQQGGFGEGPANAEIEVMETLTSADGRLRPGGATAGSASLRQASYTGASRYLDELWSAWALVSRGSGSLGVQALSLEALLL